MKKNKQNKFPFAALRKGVVSGLLGITMLAGASVFSGCGAGPAGETGSQGPQGEPGEAGISTYVGYDGYIWQGAERTEFKGSDITLGEGVAENTIGVETTMSKYFAGSYVDLSENRIALIANYMPYSSVTQYSGSKVLKIKVVAETDGILHVGTANVAAIIAAKTTGAQYTAQTEAYNVKAGLNTIELDIEVGSNETLVLGGEGSVGLYVAHGIGVSDEHGNFVSLNGQTNENFVAQTNGKDDTLAVQVSVEVGNPELYQAISTVVTDFNNLGFTNAKYTAYDPSAAPFTYANKDYFSGRILRKIGVPLFKLSDYTKDCVFTVYVIKKDKADGGNYNNSSNYVSKHELVIPANTFNKNDVKQWYYFDFEQPIVMAADETLAFFDPADTVFPGYMASAGDSDYHFLLGSKGSGGTSTIYFDLQYSESISGSFEGHLEKLKEAEEKAKDEAIKAAKVAALVEKLNGKNFSILGDSISTFAGYSNDSTNTNSTIGSNAVYYQGSNILTNVNQTWWKQLATITSMNVLVNNSWSGEKVTTNGSSGGTSRCEQLHDNTGDNAGTNPDIIAVYLGINDYDHNVTAGSFESIDWDTLIVDNNDGTFTYGSATTFADYYAIMVHKMVVKYNQTDIFLFTHVPNGSNSRPISDLEKYNDIITKIANKYGCTIVDLYNDSGITNANKTSYMGDGNQALHPNALGMDLITECFWNVLYNKYVANA